MTNGQGADEVVAAEELERRNAIGTSWDGAEMALEAVALVAVAVAVTAVVVAEHGDADEDC